MAILRAVRSKVRAWLEREIPGYGTKKKRRAEGEGLPDPAEALDRFDRWVEKRLPAEPRPAWANGVLFGSRLVVGARLGE